VSWPVPQPGLVIRYAYLWRREALAGQEEGAKPGLFNVVRDRFLERARRRKAGLVPRTEP
jgi:hypothetical protein